MTAPTTSGHGLIDVSGGVASDARLEVTAGPVGKGKPDEARREACPSARHDRATDYSNHGCRCTGARADRERRRKAGHLMPSPLVPAVGARRRLQALMVLGHSQNELAAYLGRQPGGSLGPLLWDPKRLTCTREVHDRVIAAYELLWDKPGTGSRAKVVRVRALARGWVPPLALDDDLIDDPTYDPSMPRISPRAERKAERLEAVGQLTAKGRSAREIAERLGVHPREVNRDRAELRARENAA
jgi:hypothetical protein